MRSRAFLTTAVAASVLAGCGGGGGGGSSVTVRYQTSWTTRVSGASQVVSLYDASGALVRSQTINSAGGAAQFVSFSGLAAGAYRLRADLMSGADGSGTITGRLESTTTVSAGATASIVTDAGSAVANLALTPDAPSVPLDAKQNFTVAGVAADGNLTFLNPASVQWSSNSAALTIDALGVATAARAGSATITVRDADTGLTKSTLAVVPSPPRTAWTFLVYLDAANDLLPYGFVNVNQMELLGANANARFVVQWKQLKSFSSTALFDGTRRYLVQPDTDPNTVKSTMLQDLGGAVDMGNANTMRAFIDWAMIHYPADHTALIMWDHGNGWVPRALVAPKTRAIHFDDQFGTTMSIPSIRTALSGIHLDVIAMDACLMQEVEIATEFKDLADYIVTSEDLTPGPGYLYDACFKPFFNNPNQTTPNLLKAICDAQVGDPRYANTPVTQSFVDTSKMANLNAAIDNLAGVLIANVASMGPTMTNVRANAYRVDPAAVLQYYYDLGDLMNQMIQDANCPNAVKLACGQVQTAMASAVPYAVHSKDFPNAWGITIDLTPAKQYNASMYGTLQFAQTTRWGQWLAIAP